MDRECVSALPRVCEVLAASGGSLPDDTSLEKLLDWFTELSVSLLEACPCLLGFVSAVVSNDAASEPSVLSFTLKLTGLLAASEDGFKVLQAAGLWEDPCIRIGWIQGLRTMLQHSQALDFFVQADFTEPLLQLQTDTSLFVASAASQTLAHVLLLCQSVPSPEGRHRETIPVETDGKYSAVVAGFCDYLKKSLLLCSCSRSASVLSDGAAEEENLLRLHDLYQSDKRPAGNVHGEFEDRRARPSSGFLIDANPLVFLTFPSQAPDCLPCSPAEIVSAVLSVLRLCSGDSPSSSPGCAEVLRNVTGSGRVQKCALDALSALTAQRRYNSPAAASDSFLRDTSTCAALCKDSSLSDLVQVVRKRVCDVRWEVRDSTVEFLGHLAAAPASLASDKEKARNALECLPGGRCATVPLLQEALQDPEGYVRASSVSALHHLSRRCAETSLHEGAEKIVTRLLEILSQDTQGFSRRAVIRFFVAWISSCSSPSSCSLLTQSIPSILSRGSADLDWEVKVHTLELAELLLDRASESRRHPYAVTPDRTSTHARAVESDPVSMLNSLVDQGVFSALLSGLVDCDRPVGLKACQLLIRLRDTVCPLLLGDQDVSDALVSGSRASCELPGCGWAREVRRILGTATAPRNVHGADGLGPEDRGEEEEEEPAVRVGVCDALRRLRLDERLAVLAQSSDHVHNSPLSLLQDILTVSRTKTHLDSQLGQEVIVDCY
uniref:BRCA1-associated ATM activator 1 n=1 Tax=Kryptolebias marmoratus TaxID=37003 RepID=A0A3Q3A105_KRYMA